MTELRSYVFIDRLQPRTLCYLGATSKGSLPRSEMSTLLLDVTPALDIEQLTDVALKSVNIQPSLLQLDSRGGWLGLHGDSSDEVRAAADTLLTELGADTNSLKPPKIVNSKVVSRVDAAHAFMINRQKSGCLCVPGESLFMLDCQPATYALLAANEAEKAADVKIVDVRITGSQGRLFLSGKDANIRAAAEAAETALKKLGS